DPTGATERVEYLPNAPGVAATPASVPAGVNIAAGTYALSNTFHWDKHAYAQVAHPPTSAADYAKAEIFHWLSNSQRADAPIIAATKQPLENYVFYNYPGQPDAASVGSTGTPSAVGRVLDDGTSQVATMTWNSLGLPLTRTDPLGRTKRFTYDSGNNIDLLTVEQQTSATPTWATLAALGSYTTAHKPQNITDAAGQTTHITYNAAGQPSIVTDPLGNSTTLNYDTFGRLTSIVNAN